MKLISIWASGNGSNAENLINYFKNHKTIKIDNIVCNNPNAGIINRAKRLGVDCFVFVRKDFNEGDSVLKLMTERKVNAIVLSGFLQKVSQKIINSYNDAIINIHPALLPDFGGKGMYGKFVHEAVIASKKSESGITIHLVNEVYDNGKIIEQFNCSVLPSDTPYTLAERIHELEYKWFPIVVERYLAR